MRVYTHSMFKKLLEILMTNLYVHVTEKHQFSFIETHSVLTSPKTNQLSSDFGSISFIFVTVWLIKWLSSVCVGGYKDRERRRLLKKRRQIIKNVQKMVIQSSSITEPHRN